MRNTVWLSLFLLSCIPFAFSQDGKDPADHVVDEVAYPHLFSVMAPRAGEEETPEELARRRGGFIRHVGLNPTQGEVLSDIADRYHAYMGALKDQA